jgi:hypothetical protein
MDNLNQLEREIELLKEIVELKTKLLEIEKVQPTKSPYIPDPYKPIYPSYPSYPFPNTDWWKPKMTWC